MNRGLNSKYQRCSSWRSRLTGFLFLTALALPLLPMGSLQAAPASAAGKRSAPGFVMIKLARGPLNRLVLSAKVDGKEGTMILDTGASVSVADAGKYTFLLLGPGRVLPPGIPKNVKANGHLMRMGLARSVKIGSTELGPMPLVIGIPGLFAEDRGMSNGNRFDGLLGEDLLRRYRGMVDCSRLFLYLTLDPALKVDAGSRLVPAGWTRIPMRELDGLFTVECTLGKNPYRLIVDTGAPFTALDGALVERERIRTRDLPMSGGFVGTLHKRAQLVATRTLLIGNYVVSDAEMMSRQDLVRSLNPNFGGSPPVLGVLGGDMLARNNAIIDVGNRCLYLKHGLGDGKKP